MSHPQFFPQPQTLHFAAGRVLPAIIEKGKLDHIEERLRAMKEAKIMLLLAWKSCT